MKKINSEVERDQQERIRFGYLASTGLDSEFWLVIVKPILDSMLKGITDINSVDISSEKKASIELAGRKMASRYISEIETLINGYIVDAETTKVVIEKRKKGTELYKTV